MSAHSAGSKPAKATGGDKRERILDAAEVVFAERGFFHARIAEIAREAGVADGTIYLYFKSKDDLLISWFESRMERVNAVLRDAVAGGASPRDKLLRFIGAHLALVAERPKVAEVLTIELRQSNKFMKEAANPRFGEFLKGLASIIEDGQKAGHFDASIPPQLGARAIFGMLDEIALSWLLTRGQKFDIESAAEWIGALTLHGLEGAGERRPR